MNPTEGTENPIYESSRKNSIFKGLGSPLTPPCSLATLLKLPQGRGVARNFSRGGIFKFFV